ncbi:MAG: pyruvate ferredoxin oxidoreductase [candidate division Zixibacteria bacterium]|nr:pyruvate ferredoxin oxidoreductase [candidate division Zixibacteria bacterium]MBU1471246.1 pyruvate ferredoxin oxidoreductase [candidate division Zixibacteria bacterium]MBU2624948.1 pyruvate ferredoxin oxidoreductase [candidate division Zixibacteria bacterium]
MYKVISGSHSVSHAVRLARAQVITAYPITPQTSVVEKLSEFCADGSLDAKFIKVESEHSAMASLIGASAVGARCFTATSSHGLALMHEMLHWAAGDRLPIVMANVNRAMGAPWSIWVDHSDSLSQRDTGWMQLYVESNQEIIDTVIQAFKIAETVHLPIIVNLDGFFLSHTVEEVDIPEQSDVDSFLPPYEAEHKLDVNDPRSIGNLTTPDHFYEFRHMAHDAAQRALKLIEEVGAEYGEKFGRRYGIIDSYMMDDAEIALVAYATAASTTRATVKEMRAEGKKVGMVKIRSFRPFPAEALISALRNVPKIAVLDRNVSIGSTGIFCQEVKAALYDASLHNQIFGFVVGLGGRDITPDVVRNITAQVEGKQAPESAIYWEGLKV